MGTAYDGDILLTVACAPVSVRLAAHLCFWLRARARIEIMAQRPNRGIRRSGCGFKKRMKRKGLALAVGIGCMALGQASWGQRFGNWRPFRLGDGLPESACSAVTISPQGKVLVRHVRSPMMRSEEHTSELQSRL